MTCACVHQINDSQLNSVLIICEKALLTIVDAVSIHGSGLP
jgi:hypothetical protein